MAFSLARLARGLGLATALLLATAGATSASPTTPRPVSTTPVPILMYHVVAAAPPGAAYPELFVSERDFAAQMRWLTRKGYEAVTQRDVWNHWQGGAPLPRKPIVISFDDGYRSVADAAFPHLRSRGWPAVVNLTVKNLTVSGGLSQFRVRRLLDAGWELASHTVTHPDLRGLSDAALRHEVAGSRSALRARFGVPVDFFCYPAGRYDSRVIRAVRGAGYLGATTTIEGLARPSERFELRRIRVSGSDGVRGLAARLES